MKHHVLFRLLIAKHPRTHVLKLIISHDSMGKLISDGEFRLGVSHDVTNSGWA